MHADRLSSALGRAPIKRSVQIVVSARGIRGGQLGLRQMLDMTGTVLGTGAEAHRTGATALTGRPERRRSFARARLSVLAAGGVRSEGGLSLEIARRVFLCGKGSARREQVLDGRKHNDQVEPSRGQSLA